MALAEKIECRITGVEGEGPFIKVRLAKDPDFTTIQNQLQEFNPIFESDIWKVSKWAIHDLVVYKSSNGSWCRGRIAEVNDNKCLVNAVDLGGSEVVLLKDLRQLQALKGSVFEKMPGLAKTVFLCGIVSTGSWKTEVIASAQEFFKMQRVTCCLQKSMLAILRRQEDDLDIAQMFLQRTLGESISIDKQERLIRSYFESKALEKPVKQVATSAQLLVQTKLDVGSIYEIYVSSCNDGPSLFAVQLADSKDLVSAMETSLNTLDLQPLRSALTPGSGCLAAIGKNQALQRGYVMSVKADSHEIYVVDYGYTQLVSTSQLMELPDQLAHIKPLAVKVTHCGASDLPKIPAVPLIFQFLVKKKPFKMLVTYTEGSVPSCILLNTDNVNVLDTLRQYLGGSQASTSQGMSPAVFSHASSNDGVRGNKRVVVPSISDSELHMQKRLRNDTLPDSQSQWETFLPALTTPHSAPLVGKVHVDAIYDTPDMENTPLYVRREHEASVTMLHPRSMDNMRSVSHEPEYESYTSMQPSAITELVGDQMYKSPSSRHDSRFSKPPPPIRESPRTFSSEVGYNQDLTRHKHVSPSPPRSHFADTPLYFEQNSPIRKGDRGTSRDSWSIDRDYLINQSPMMSKSSEQNLESGRSPVKRSSSPVMDSRMSGNKRVRYDEHVYKTTDRWNDDKKYIHQNDQGSGKAAYGGGFKSENDRDTGSTYSSRCNVGGSSFGQGFSSNKDEGSTYGRGFGSNRDEGSTYGGGFKNSGRSNFGGGFKNSGGSQFGGGFSSDSGKSRGGFSASRSPGFSNMPCRMPALPKFCFTPQDLTPSKMSLAVFPTFMISPGNFYMQLESTSEELTKLMDRILQVSEVSDGDVELSQLDPLDACLAKFMDDGLWYRAQVVSVTEAKVKVKFVDYGNVVDVEVSDLKLMTPELLSLPAQAINCCLRGVKPAAGEQWSEVQLNKFTELIDSVTLQAKVVGLEGLRLRQYSVVLHSDTTCLNTAMSALPDSLLPCNSLASSDMPLDAAHEVFISWFLTPDDFHFFLTANLQERDWMYNEFADMECPKLKSVEVGDLVLARKNNTYFRAKVLATRDTQARVKHLDQGSVLICETSELCVMPESLKSMPAFAVACAMSGITPTSGSKWQRSCDAINSVFKSAPSFSLQVQGHHASGKLLVSLQAGDKDVAQTLVERGLAAAIKKQEDKLAPGHSCPVFVCYSEGLSKIFIHEVSKKDDLSNLHERLQVSNPQIPASLSEALVAAKNPDNDTWYRAKVLKHTDQDVTVLYIDYGNTHIIPVVHQLSAELCDVPPFAHACRLAVLPPAGETWPPQAVAKFKALAFDERTQVSARVLTQHGGFLLVDLVMDNVTSLIDTLLQEQLAQPMTWDAYVSCIESASNFHVQRVQDESTLQQIAKRLATVDLEDADLLEVGMECVAKFSADDTWYRACVLAIKDGSARVQFMDYGNCEEASEFKKMPEDLSSMTAVAMACSLACKPVSEQDFVDAAMDGTAIVQVLFLDGQQTPAQVIVLRDGKHIVAMEEEAPASFVCDTEVQDSKQTVELSTMDNNSQPLDLSPTPVLHSDIAQCVQQDDAHLSEENVSSNAPESSEQEETSKTPEENIKLFSSNIPADTAKIKKTDDKTTEENDPLTAEVPMKCIGAEMEAEQKMPSSSDVSSESQLDCMEQPNAEKCEPVFEVDAKTADIEGMLQALFQNDPCSTEALCGSNIRAKTGGESLVGVPEASCNSTFAQETQDEEMENVSNTEVIVSECTNEQSNAELSKNSDDLVFGPPVKYIFAASRDAYKSSCEAEVLKEEASDGEMKEDNIADSSDSETQKSSIVASQGAEAVTSNEGVKCYQFAGFVDSCATESVIASDGEMQEPISSVALEVTCQTQNHEVSIEIAHSPSVLEMTTPQESEPSASSREMTLCLSYDRTLHAEGISRKARNLCENVVETGPLRDMGTRLDPPSCETQNRSVRKAAASNKELLSEDEDAVAAQSSDGDLTDTAETDATPADQ